MTLQAGDYVMVQGEETAFPVGFTVVLGVVVGASPADSALVRVAPEYAGGAVGAITPVGDSAAHVDAHPSNVYVLRATADHNVWTLLANLVDSKLSAARAMQSGNIIEQIQADQCFAWSFQHAMRMLHARAQPPVQQGESHEQKTDEQDAGAEATGTEASDAPR